MSALKGAGFFLGGLLLSLLGFRESLWAMAASLVGVLLACVLSLPSEMGKAKSKAKLATLLSKSREINVLSAARLFLFGARDIWFVVGVPVFLSMRLGWGFTEVGGFLALWVVGYGAVQSVAPLLIRRLIAGLGVFGAIFAVNVGFYYVANAGGRLVGTLLSGTLYQLAGVSGCLWGTVAFAIVTAAISMWLPRTDLGSKEIASQN